jgi:DNA-binding NarL/FixJ family response regulator
MKPLKKYSVLIIDSNQEFAEALKQLIIDVAGQIINIVECVYNRFDGLTSFLNNDYQYVFMDVDMPFHDGLSMSHFAKKENQKNKPILIVTSFYTDASYRKQMIRAGANRYLPKDEISADKIIEIFGIAVK